MKKENLAEVFSCEFFETFKDTYFIEHLRWLFLDTFHAVITSKNALSNSSKKFGNILRKYFT